MNRDLTEWLVLAKPQYIYYTGHNAPIVSTPYLTGTDFFARQFTLQHTIG